MSNLLKTRILGKTGIEVTELGFGGAPLGNLYRAVTDEAACKTMTHLLEAGVRYFDTAPHYGFGLSERRIGDGLRPLGRDEFVLSTKVGRLLKPDHATKTSALRHGYLSPMPFESVYDYSYAGVMRSFEDSLQRLGLDRIDILLLHDIGKLTHGDDHEALFKIAMEGGYKALDELRSTGDIKAIGLGVNEWQVCEQAMAYGDFDCFLLAGRYTLLEQHALDSFLPKCEQSGTPIILGGVYNSGILAVGTKTDEPLFYDYKPAPPGVIERVQKIEAVCEAYQVALPAAALQFPLAHPLVATVIPGVDSEEKVVQTLAYYQAKIPAAFWHALIDEGLLDARAPIPVNELREAG